MRKLPLLIACLIPVFAGSRAVAECNPALRIGMITGLTGPAKSWGESNKNGLELGLNDARCGSIVRIYEDDQYNWTKSITAFRKLVEVDHANVVIGTSSNSGNAIAPVAERMKIPFLVWASDINVSAGRKYVIRIWNRGPDEGTFLVQRAAKKGYRKIAFVYDLLDYSQSVHDGILAEIARDPSKLELSAEEGFPTADADYRSFITKVRAKPVDAFCLCLMTPGNSGLFAKQLRQLGIDSPLFGCEGMELQGNFGESGGALKQAWFSTEAVQKNFADRYRGIYGEPGTLPGVAIMYDVAAILMATNAAGGETLVQEIMSGGVHHGAMGEFQPVKTATDQYFNIPFVERYYDGEGKIQDAAQ